MAGGSLIALIDDIASVLDDVAVLTQVAARKTAGVLGDDLALNAQQVSGVAADRELPVVWAVAKGSAVNKLILVPLALLISAFAPWAVTPLLILGGAFLCYEGFEKLAHRFVHGKAAARRAVQVQAPGDPAVDVAALERAKVKGAVRTDFVLSAEIIAITLGTVADAAFITQVAVLAGIAIVMTIGVYGVVACIVKLDDLGLHLSRQAGAFARAWGRAILRAAPTLMKGLSIAGTAAMFLVGGGILTHGVPPLQRAIERLAQAASDWPGIGGVAAMLAPWVADALVGVAAGGLVMAAVAAGSKASRVSRGGKRHP